MANGHARDCNSCANCKKDGAHVEDEDEDDKDDEKDDAEDDGGCNKFEIGDGPMLVLSW